MMRRKAQTRHAERESGVALLRATELIPAR
jgi:hypothetical protein